MALALLVAGEVAVAMLPVRVSLEVDASRAQLTMDGSSRVLSLDEGVPTGGRVQFLQPGPVDREFQIDGSDTTSREDRDAALFRALAETPAYRVLAWLRDEGSYSRWDDIRVYDLTDGRLIASGRRDVESASLPSRFRLEASLRRPESPARIRLESAGDTDIGVLAIDRDAHQARWSTDRNDEDASATWFFPNEPWPFAAELLHLLGRSAAAAIGMLAAMLAIGRVAPRSRLPRVLLVSSPPPLVVACGILVVWLTAALWITVRLYHQLPHIVDAEAYAFQARIFQTGRTWLEAPELVRSLDGFQQVIWNNRWFSQYPPGAPVLYALGGLVGLAWLVGPVATLAMIAAVGVTGRLLFGRAVALIAIALAALSPFVLFQAGTFMSHPIAGAAVACALAAFVYAARSGDARWYVAAGAALGLAFDTREIAALVYGVAFVAWLALHRQGRPIISLLLGAVPFVAAYLLYNLSTTNDLFLLPRNVFNEKDRWGFGDVGSAGMHTLAAGLVNTDENLTLLQFDLFGWPPLAALALIGTVFLLGRARRADYLLAACAGGFVLAYVGYFYHGIALGPRYYFEAVPALTVLAARGMHANFATLLTLGLTRRASVIGCAVLMGALSTYSILFYFPHSVDRRMDYGALSHGRRLVVPSIQSTLVGPKLTQVTTPALVLVPSDDVFKTVSALNCPLLDQGHIADCPVLLVRANVNELAALTSRFPGRSVWLMEAQGDLVTLNGIRMAARSGTAN